MILDLTPADWLARRTEPGGYRIGAVTGGFGTGALETLAGHGVRTPIGRYGGALSGVRTDDLGAVPIRSLMARNPGVDWAAVDDLIYGCANQAGEDNRNVARMAGLLAGIIVPLLAWWTRYWFATALAGHVTLAALIVMTHATLRSGNLSLPSLGFENMLGAARPGAAVILLAALTLFVLVMCLADHLAFLRFFVSLFRRTTRAA